MKAVIDFAKNAAQATWRHGLAPALGIYKKGLIAYYDFCVISLPTHVAGKMHELDTAGWKYCTGRRARTGMPAGIVMRDAAQAGLLPFNNAYVNMATHVASFAFGAAVIKACALPAATLLGAALPCALGSLALFPAVTALMAIALPTALCLAGGLLGVPRGLCNIGTGRAVAREWQEQKKRDSQPRKLFNWEVDSLPVLERSFYYELDKIAEAPAHERVQWLEAIKQKFPEDFARAAVLRPDELGTQLNNEMQVKKKPLHIRKPKSGLAKKIGSVFGRT